MSSLQQLFDLKCLIRNIKIRLFSRIESSIKQLLALISDDGDVVLHYTYGEMPAVIKRIPWLSETSKAIQAVCFDPTATWLLIVSYDGSLYIIPALGLLDKKQKIDCKWSLTDLTHFPRHSAGPEGVPTSVVWWQTSDCNQNALVGHDNGTIALISLTDGRFLGSCAITEAISRLFLCQDNSFDAVFLLINGQSGHQWRLMLEQNSQNYLWPTDTGQQTENEGARSRLYSLRQMGVDKLASLKQRLVEARGGARKDSTDTVSESNSDSTSSTGPELMPYMCDAFFSPQYARNCYLFSAFHKPTSLATIFPIDVESPPLFVYKLMEKTDCLLLTDRLIFAVNEDFNLVSVISTQLAECRMEGDSEFHSESLLAQFGFEQEKILQIYKLTDLTLPKRRRKEDSNNKKYELPKTVEELNINKPRIDTCVVITNNSVYKIVIKTSPTVKFVHLVTEENNMEQAEKLSLIFGLNLQQLLENCGDLMIANGAFHTGIILYKQAKVHILKRVLKLAISADCKTLLKFVHLCLNASRVDMALATKIHIGNVAVMAYTELILRPGAKSANLRDFMNFLRFEEFYDQVLAVNVACQAGRWSIVSLLAKARGLQPEIVAAFSQILQRMPARAVDRDFLTALSEPCLSQSLVIFQQSHEIFTYIRANLEFFPVEILKRFAVQLDPSQPCVVPLVRQLVGGRKSSLSTTLDSSIDNFDHSGQQQSIAVVRDFVETFVQIMACLVAKTDDSGYDLKLLEKIDLDPCEFLENESPRIKTLPRLNPLSCGYEHAAIIRNCHLYTMGVNNSGCLGLGPLLTQSSPLKLVQTLTDLKVKVLSVSCGRKHTLALTDYGVYSFGSNSYGQLGVGPLVQESPYPQMIMGLSSRKVVEICAGQYHSLALTSSGEVFTWGWGIHGQLGHGSCNNCYYPKLLEFDGEIKQITAGHAHSLILNNEGVLFGFGSNVFGQLETCNINGKKATRPILVRILADQELPLVKVASAYFHNMAQRTDNRIYTWGASPQEVRFCQSSKTQQKTSEATSPTKPVETWKNAVLIYTNFKNTSPVEQVAIGYRHTVLLHDGCIHWGRNKEPELHQPKLIDEVTMFYTKKFQHVSCGMDYTMALDRNGKLWAWGSPTMAQTLLGKTGSDDNSRRDGKVLVLKNTKRLVKFPTNLQGNDSSPVEIPGLPAMAISFKSNDQKLLFNKYFIPFAILQVENDNLSDIHFGKRTRNAIFDYIATVPNVKYGQRTLHYILETFFDYYDPETVLSLGIKYNKYQLASKVAMLSGHFADSLAFQLIAFKNYKDSFDLNFESVCKAANFVEKSTSIFVDLLNENDNLSASSSLDSIRQWGDEMEHQGGEESACDVAVDLGDVKHHVSHYVESLKSEQISSVSQIISEGFPSDKQDEYDWICDKTMRDVIENAGKLVEFYIGTVYVSENHILMQNILMKCIEFWLVNSLPVCVLENILLKNMDKYFYPLSILLFCKNWNNSLDEEIIRKCDRKNDVGFLKQFSTKFCLQLCSMVLENVNKA